MVGGGSAEDRARDLRAEARRIAREAAQWERGAEGERRVAAVLDRLPADVVVFHDLQLPGSKATVDHLVIGVGGIWLIDATQREPADSASHQRSRASDALTGDRLQGHSS